MYILKDHNLEYNDFDTYVYQYLKTIKITLSVCNNLVTKCAHFCCQKEVCSRTIYLLKQSMGDITKFFNLTFFQYCPVSLTLHLHPLFYLTHHQSLVITSSPHIHRTSLSPDSSLNCICHLIVYPRELNLTISNVSHRKI